MARIRKQPESELNIVIPSPVVVHRHTGISRAERRRKGGKGWRMLRVTNVPYVKLEETVNAE